MNTKLQENTVSNASNNNQKTEGFNMSFYQKRRQQLQKQHEERKRAQQLRQEAFQKSKKMSNQKNEVQNIVTKKSSKTIASNQQSKDTQQLNQISKVPQLTLIQNQAIEPQVPIKKIGIEEILRDGRIVKVIERTLTFDEYKVQCLYDGEIMQLIASKDEIVRNNIIPLLDFYEKILGLR